jgi:outer membrane protein OmpA-like peptidoglycan-associated protein
MILIAGLAVLLALLVWFVAVQLSAGGRSSGRSSVIRRATGPTAQDAASSEPQTTTAPEPSLEAQGANTEPTVGRADVERETATPPFGTVSLYFAAESAVLTAEARRILDEVAIRLRTDPQMPVRIEGHCALFGSERGRIALSRMRAEAVRDYLVERGWRPLVPPTVVGIGGERPLTTEPQAQNRNRRVEISAGDR